MIIAFRTDAANHIGAGHLMRCLTLANAFRQEGAETLFICREHEGHLIDHIIAQGHQCLKLSKPSREIAPPGSEHNPAHAAWLGEAWETDLQQCQTVLAGQKIDWLVVDHYALDYRWEVEMRNLAQHIMVIDDLADRKHDCEILLDQTLGRESEVYTPWVPAHCMILAGAQYALLRPEFAQWREFSLARRKTPLFKKLLVSLAGVDGNNNTAVVLEALAGCPLPKDLEITVVIGISAPHLASVKAIAQRMPVKTEVIMNVHNMAEVMANCDIAIGAAGATSWERCCLGLPTLMLCLAENQKNAIGELVKRHTSESVEIDHLKDCGAKALWPTLNHLIESASDYIAASIQVTDGLGCQKTMKKIYGLVSAHQNNQE